MSKLILLIVGAAWMAVLLPPLLRSRFDGGSVSSVSDFRRQLHTLQRTQSPMQSQSPMRAMARPLASAPRTMPRPRLVENDATFQAEPRHSRTHATAELPRVHHMSDAALISPREMVRRRRVNVLYGLVAANALTLFLAFTTGSTAMVYFFALAFLGLGAYCYVLVQIRNQEHMRRYRTHRYAA